MHKQRDFILTWPGGKISLHRCRVMGILNVTHDSFYDGGKYAVLDDSVERAWQMVDEGADIIDVGAESSRPGAKPVSLEEERSRLFPLLKQLQSESFPLPISLDTQKPELVDEACRENWIQIVNDIGGFRNPRMAEVTAKHQRSAILMHMAGNPENMQESYSYDDVVNDIRTFFVERLQERGIHDNVVLDPGIGFGKSVAHNLSILHRLNEFLSLGFPLMVGASRKSFIGKTLDLPVEERLEGSLAALAIAVDRGAKIVRVHDVLASVRTVRMVEAIGSQIAENSPKNP